MFSFRPASRAPESPKNLNSAPATAKLACLPGLLCPPGPQCCLSGPQCCLSCPAGRQLDAKWTPIGRQVSAKLDCQGALGRQVGLPRRGPPPPSLSPLKTK